MLLKDLWNLFTETGNIEYYLMYREESALKKNDRQEIGEARAGRFGS